MLIIGLVRVPAFHCDNIFATAVPVMFLGMREKYDLLHGQFLVVEFDLLFVYASNLNNCILPV